MVDADLSAEFAGLEFHASRLRKGSTWHEQASSNHHYGFSRSKGLWLIEVEPFQRCSHQPVKLFLLVRLGTKHLIRSVDTSVHQVYTDGSFDILEAPFFQPDLATARSLLVEALTPTSRATREERRRPQLRLVDGGHPLNASNQRLP